MNKPTTYLVANYKVEGVENYSTLSSCIEYLKTQKVLGLDIETTKKYKAGTFDENVYKGGLDPYLSKVVMIQLGSLKRIYVIDVRQYTKEELKPLIELLNYNPNLLLVIHNAKFEGKHLKYNYGIRLLHVWDTMLCEMNLYNGLKNKYTLASLAESYLGVKSTEDTLSLFGEKQKKVVTLNEQYLENNEFALTPFEVEDSFILDKSTRLQFLSIGDAPFTKEQVLYGSDDILFPLLIRERQLLGRKLDSGEIYNPKVCHKIENNFSQVLVDIELEGMTFDKRKWEEIANNSEQLFEQRRKDLEEYVVTLYPSWGQLSLFNPIASSIIDWGSSKQVISFFKSLKCCPKEVSKQTKKLDWTVGAVAFLKVLPNEYKGYYFKNKWKGFTKDERGNFVENNNDLILAYLLLKKTEQATTTFGKEWLKYVHPITGRVHSSFRQILNTGRMSSTNPNCQNLPSGDYRKCFVAREGWSILNADYSAQEIRVVADLTKDEAFVDFFLVGDETFGDDFHSYTATKMYRVMNNDPEFLVPPKDLPNGESNPAFQGEHGKMRNNAKAINFKINYGGSANSLKDDFGVEEEVAQMFIDTYLDAFPTLRDNFETTKRDVVKKGFVLIDKVSDRRWFSPFHKEMERLIEDIRSYYPEGYFSGAYKGEAKEQVKKDLYETYPFLRDMWRDYFRLHGKLERAGLNYRIQGCLPSSTRVLTTNGYETLKDFNRGLVWNGENWVEAEKIYRGFAKMVTLKLSNGFSFRCDNRHQMFILNKEKELEICDVNNILGKELALDNSFFTTFGAETGLDLEKLTRKVVFDTKKLPKELFTSTKGERQQFIDLFLELTKGNSESLTLLQDINLILLSIGKFGEVFLSEGGNYNLKVKEGMEPIFVTEVIEEDLSEPTYTLSVFDNSHRFSTEGFISKNTAAMMMKTSMVLLRKKLIETKNDSFVLTNIIHDESLGETKPEKSKENGKLLSDCMVEGGKVFCKTVPMKADAVCSDYWQH